MYRVLLYGKRIQGSGLSRRGAELLKVFVMKRLSASSDQVTIERMA